MDLTDARFRHALILRFVEDVHRRVPGISASQARVLVQRALFRRALEDTLFWAAATTDGDRLHKQLAAYVDQEVEAYKIGPRLNEAIPLGRALALFGIMCLSLILVGVGIARVVDWMVP